MSIGTCERPSAREPDRSSRLLGSHHRAPFEFFSVHHRVPRTCVSDATTQWKAEPSREPPQLLKAEANEHAEVPSRKSME